MSIKPQRIIETDFVSPKERLSEPNHYRNYDYFSDLEDYYNYGHEHLNDEKEEEVA